MKSRWTTFYKPQIESTLNTINLNKKDGAYKLIMKFEKAVNSCHTLIENGTNYETMYYTTPMNVGIECLKLLNNGGHSCSQAKYATEWKAYCNARGYAIDIYMSDCLA